ncbi:MAG: hypothetical protein JNM51_17700 [Bacteroidia bacterium]|nr:hypothetical protein [Bacteroidia bacterium]
MSISIALFTIAFIGNIFFFKTNETLLKGHNSAVLHADSILAVKLNTDKKLDALTENYSTCNQKNNKLDTLLNELKKELNIEKTELIRLRNLNGSDKLKKQLKEAQNQNIIYSQKINTLLKETSELENKISELNAVISSLKTDHFNLKSKFEKAISLKAFDIVVTTYKNATITKKAKRTNKIGINFTIPENDLAETGSKEINILIYNPKGQIVSAKGSKFQNKTLQKEQVYTINKSITYNNKDTKESVDIECSCRLDKGTYNAEIYIDGKLAGKKDFILK